MLIYYDIHNMMQIFRGNRLLQATKQHLNNSETVQCLLEECQNK